MHICICEHNCQMRPRHKPKLVNTGKTSYSLNQWLTKARDAYIPARAACHGGCCFMQLPCQHVPRGVNAMMVRRPSYVDSPTSGIHW